MNCAGERYGSRMELARRAEDVIVDAFCKKVGYARKTLLSSKDLSMPQGTAESDGAAVTLSDCHTLARVVASEGPLAALDFRITEGDFGDEGLHVLLASLELGAPSIHTLILSRCGIQDEGVTCAYSPMEGE